ncbi:GNAT family N-acetyltransferase [Alkalicoccobacillus gibsonii]|uniref:GNAT family N-acetyltransferase n=1 Tax=Alkalicoccobacillus gibsonii TaxID=79881 RepID=A0ABU9VGB1_9BACI
MEIRTLQISDQQPIISVLNEWWGGREMAHMLPALFFHHFNQTSFISEENGEMVGFLIGFLSQTHPSEVYIHFVGVHPNYRNQKIGQALYRHFFQKVQKEGRSIVRCITSPQNKDSIAYHQRMGFTICSGDALIDGIQVHTNYDGAGSDRVVFEKKL